MRARSIDLCEWGWRAYSLESYWCSPCITFAWIGLDNIQGSKVLAQFTNGLHQHLLIYTNIIPNLIEQKLLSQNLCRVL